MAATMETEQLGVKIFDTVECEEEMVNHRTGPNWSCFMLNGIPGVS